ncbi:unnamed protein product [Ranitomeya imitator]|uniref:Helix-turn-helix domain-containing protein n=1 Tax=Ranitomeya imitator TaxID=111125 RepID=A0ABN9LAW7_9NEOB|nr:unnamed protein product [Ranitomeya imitator]
MIIKTYILQEREGPCTLQEREDPYYHKSLMSAGERKSFADHKSFHATGERKRGPSDHKSFHSTEESETFLVTLEKETNFAVQTILIENNTKSLMDIDKELDDLSKILSRDMPNDQFMKWTKDLEVDISKLEEKVSKEKLKKYQRDVGDYDSNKIYRWQSRGLQVPRNTRTRTDSDVSYTSGSNISTSDSEATCDFHLRSNDKKKRFLEKFQKSQKGPKSKDRYQSLLIDILDKAWMQGIVSKKLVDHIKNCRPRLPTFYLIPKIHKDPLDPPGTAMGASCAPSYANLFLGAWEREVFHNDNIQLVNHVHNWMRYIDDVLFFWDGPKGGLDDLMAYLNNNDQNIRLTFKYGKEIDFLDIKLTVDLDVRLNTDVFRKATATNSFLVANSSHPPATIRGIPVGQFLRAKRICSNDSNFEKQAIDLRRRFTERGYSKKMIRKGYQRACGISRDRLLYGPCKAKKMDQQHPIRFISTYSNQWNHLKDIIRKHWQVLKVDPVLCKILPESPSFVPKRSANLKDILVQSHYDPKNSGTKKSLSGLPGFFPCGLCKGCLNHVKSRTFCNHDGSRSFNIWKHLSCNSQGVIYHAQCPCGKVYVGLTTLELKTRKNVYCNIIAQIFINASRSLKQVMFVPQHKRQKQLTTNKSYHTLPCLISTHMPKCFAYQ